MKTKHFLTTFGLLLGLAVKAQLVPVGSAWHYGTYTDLSPATGHLKYEAVADTVIANDTFSIVQSSPLDRYFLKREDSKIYYWLQNRKCLLFDENIKYGHTITIDAYLRISYDRDTIVSASVVLDTMYYYRNNLYDANDTIIIYRVSSLTSLLEGYGFGDGGFVKSLINIGSYEYNFIGIFKRPSNMSFWMNFRCFSSPDYNYKDTSWKKSCDYSNVGINEIKQSAQVAISPNPNKGDFNLSFNNNEQKTIRVFDMLGNLVYTKETLERAVNIGLENARNGIYFVNVQTEKGSRNAKILLE